MTTLYVDNIAPNLQSKISAPNLQLPSGSVVQVVASELTSSPTTQSTSWVSTGLTASITPSSTSSKILVVYAGMYAANNLSNHWGSHGIQKNGVILNSGSMFGPSIANATNSGQVTLTKLDSPNTTSSTTYTVVYRSEGNSTLVRINDGWGSGENYRATLTLMEIAG